MQIRCVFAGIFTLMLATQLMAEDTTLVVEGSSDNAFFTQYSLVADHPDCADAGELAIGVHFAAPAQSYEIRDLDRGIRATVMVDGMVNVDDRLCTRTERRGTETMQLATKCSAAVIEESRKDIEAMQFVLRIEGEFKSCLSPTGHRLLENSWAVSVSDMDNQQRYEGVFERPDPATGPILWRRGPYTAPAERVTEPSAAISFQMLQPFLYSWNKVDHPHMRRFESTTVARIALECIPFTAQDYAPNPIYLETEFYLVFADEPVTSCVGEDCPSVDFSQRFSRTRAVDYKCAAQE
jgi:hypothetical protein